MYKAKLIVGGAGFIGSQLARRLLNDNNFIVIIDNLSRGSLDYIDDLYLNSRCTFLKYDVAERNQCLEAFQQATSKFEIDEVWHLAANSDIPAGVMDPNIDLKDTFLSTFEILYAMKKFNIRYLNFASSSAIYGDFGDEVIYENIGPLLPISNYGAMKLASEAQISAAAESFLNRVNIFRFPNVVGVPATHGVILDFCSRLSQDSTKLIVLGNGAQQKAYLHVQDLIDAMLFVTSIKETLNKVEVFNIGPLDSGVTVKWIAESVIARISPKAEIVFGESSKGWVGDVPKFKYSVSKLQSYNWHPRLGSSEAVLKAINEIALQLGFKI